MPSTTTTRHSSQPGRIVRAGRVGDVVVHLMKTVKGKSRQSPTELFEQCLEREDAVVLLGRNRVDQIHGAVGGIVEAVGDLIDVSRHKIGGRQAVLNRTLWEIARVFPAAEAALRRPPRQSLRLRREPQRNRVLVRCGIPVLPARAIVLS